MTHPTAMGAAVRPGRRDSTWWLDAGADLLLGATCPGCAEPGFRLCVTCCAALAEAIVRPAPRAVLGPWPLWCGGDYAGLAQRLITAAKDRHRWDLIDALAARLAAATAALIDDAALVGPLWLIPLPSSHKAVRQRGLDVVARLSDRAAQRLTWAGLEVRVVQALEHARRVVDQSGLTYAERQANLSGAFRLRRGTWTGLSPPTGPDLVLVDDVVTTGASLAEARSCLEAVGGRVSGAATVAATADR